MVSWLMTVAMEPERSGQVLGIFRRYLLKGLEIDCMSRGSKDCVQQEGECVGREEGTREGHVDLRGGVGIRRFHLGHLTRF